MLEENRLIYEGVANSLIPEWKSMDKNELIKLAVSCEDAELKNGYISAIFLKYWNKINSYYYKCKLVASPEDVHGWLVTAVMYALDKRPWESTSSSIYGDPDGPDKVVNRALESTRLTFYQQLNRYKRKINSAISSLDTLTEDFKDVFIPRVEDDHNIFYNEIVTRYFSLKDYFVSFMLDIIMYDDVVKNELDMRKLVSYMSKIDEPYCKLFSERYGIPLDKVKKASTYVTSMTTYSIRRKIEYNLIRLKDVIR